MGNNNHAEILVKIRGLSYFRENRVIFSHIDMDIMKGKITAIMGPSGTGKTTLLKLIGGLLHPNQGFIEVAGQNIHALSRKELYQLRHSMGMLSQNGALFTDLTTFENVAFPLRENTIFSEAKIHDIVLQKLEAVGLADAKDRGANELSGGMIRRVALARAIALNPMLIMYDEPFTGLDPIALGVILNLINNINTRFKMTSILISHNVHETLSIADYVYLIDEGSVIARGTPQELQRDSNPLVQQFIHGSFPGGLALNGMNATSPNKVVTDA
jgi:phospholipid/cholesterol/gamma-HCH transport system ATP-binding protein